MTIANFSLYHGIRMRKSKKQGLLLVSLAFAVLVFSGCSKMEELRENYTPKSPREAYEYGLDASGLKNAALGIAWIEAASHAFESPVFPDVPYQENGFIDPAEPLAAGFQIALTRGQRFVARASFIAPDSGSIFLDLFQDMSDLGLRTRRVALSDFSQTLTFDANRTGTYILRFQPELLAGGRYEFDMTITSSIIFPVSGTDSGAIQSRFGDARDGGRRRHHGVDIFARRNTPVIAATDGVITSTRTGGLGGRTVWLRSGTGANLYYAHLEQQLVRRGQRVVAGDTLGLVGNSGNARTTAPHLHFGIYRNGPVDPFPFVHQPDQSVPRIMAESSNSGSWMRTALDNSGVYTGPSRRSDQIQLLGRYASVRILAAASVYYRIRLPNGTSGYIRSAQLESEEVPIEEVVLASTQTILRVPSDHAGAVGMEESGNGLRVRSRFGDYLRVTTDAGRTGWLRDL